MSIEGYDVELHIHSVMIFIKIFMWDRLRIPHSVYINILTALTLIQWGCEALLIWTQIKFYFHTQNQCFEKGFPEWWPVHHNFNFEPTTTSVRSVVIRNIMKYTWNGLSVYLSLNIVFSHSTDSLTTWKSCQK